MLNLFNFFFVSFFVVFILFVVFYYSSSFDYFSSFNYQSSFECGFFSVFSSRFSFSIHYILLSLIFVLLDLEFTMIFWFFFSSTASFYYYFIMFFFLFTVLFGLIYEWIDGNLEWFY